MKVYSKPLWSSLLAVCLLTFALGAQAVDQADDATEFKFGERSVFSHRAVEARIKSSGSVCLQGESCAGASAAGQATQLAEAAPRSAEEIYNTKCMSCHVAGVAGAPKFGDVAVWTARVEEKGLDTLVANAIKGINAMPAMGLCMDCSDEDIRLTVEYMVNAAK